MGAGVFSLLGAAVAHAFEVQLFHQLHGHILHLEHEAFDASPEIMVQRQRRDADDESRGGGDQCFGDAAGDQAGVAGAALRDDVKRLDHPKHGAQQAEHGGDVGHRAQHPEVRGEKRRLVLARAFDGALDLVDLAAEPQQSRLQNARQRVVVGITELQAEMDVLPVPKRPHLFEEIGVDDVFPAQGVEPFDGDADHEDRTEQDGVHHEPALVDDLEDGPAGDGFFLGGPGAFGPGGRQGQA